MQNRPLENIRKLNNLSNLLPKKQDRSDEPIKIWLGYYIVSGSLKEQRSFSIYIFTNNLTKIVERLINIQYLLFYILLIKKESINIAQRVSSNWACSLQESSSENNRNKDGFIIFSRKFTFRMENEAKTSQC